MKEHLTMKGLYTTRSSWHIDPCRFPMRCGKSHCIKDLYNILFLSSSKRQHITYRQALDPRQALGGFAIRR